MFAPASWLSPTEGDIVPFYPLKGRKFAPDLIPQIFTLGKNGGVQSTMCRIACHGVQMAGWVSLRCGLPEVARR
jgi:hypothetical protein